MVPEVHAISHTTLIDYMDFLECKWQLNFPFAVFYELNYQEIQGIAQELAKARDLRIEGLTQS